MQIEAMLAEWEAQWATYENHNLMHRDVGLLYLILQELRGLRADLAPLPTAKRYVAVDKPMTFTNEA